MTTRSLKTRDRRESKHGYAHNRNSSYRATRLARRRPRAGRATVVRRCTTNTSIHLFNHPSERTVAHNDASRRRSRVRPRRVDAPRARSLARSSARSSVRPIARHRPRGRSRARNRPTAHRIASESARAVASRVPPPRQRRRRAASHRRRRAASTVARRPRDRPLRVSDSAKKRFVYPRPTSARDSRAAPTTRRPRSTPARIASRITRVRDPMSVSTLDRAHRARPAPSPGRPRPSSPIDETAKKKKKGPDKRGRRERYDAFQRAWRDFRVEYDAIGAKLLKRAAARRNARVAAASGDASRIASRRRDAARRHTATRRAREDGRGATARATTVANRDRALARAATRCVRDDATRAMTRGRRSAEKRHSSFRTATTRGDGDDRANGSRRRATRDR